MPAVPFEMKEMFSQKVLPLLGQHFDFPSIVHRTILTHGIAESHLAEMLEDFESTLHKDVRLAYLPSPERLRLRFSIRGKSEEQGKEILENEIRKLKTIIGKAVYGEGNYFLEQTVFELLKERNATLATAESCTGGSISAKITSIPGSSQVFLGGTVAYSNRVKTAHLGVPESMIEKYGAVSREVVEAMAEGALERFGSDYSVAVSGIAGPEGGTEEKPVGTVWIAVSGNKKTFSKKYTFGKRRNINIQRASAKALDMLRKFILDFY
jgi:nicotinamide-nucleotide amidase